MSCFVKENELHIQTPFVEKIIPLNRSHIVKNGNIFQQCDENGLIHMNIMFGLNECLISYKHNNIQCRYHDSVSSFFMI